jgi:hypothetical protein
MKKTLLVFLMGGLLFFTIFITAGVSAIRVHGYIKDKEGQPIKDVKVFAFGISPVDLSIDIDYSDREGHYSVKKVLYNPTYVKFSKIGYQTLHKKVSGSKTSSRADITLYSSPSSRNVIELHKTQFALLQGITSDHFSLPIKPFKLR